MSSEYDALLKTACQRELESYQFYMATAGWVKDPAVVRVLTDIAGLEQKHLQQLQKIIKGELPGLEHPKVQDRNLSATFAAPEVCQNMAVEDAIKLAIKNEEDAANGYRRLAQMSPDNSTKETYVKMAAMEMAHKYSLETVLIDIKSWKKS